MEETRGSLTRSSKEYLLLLNDPVTFAQRRGIRGKAFVRYLRARAEAIKVGIRDRVEIASRARKLLDEWQARLDELDDDELPNGRAVRAFLRRMAMPAGEMNRVFYELFPVFDEQQLKRFDQRARKIFAEIDLPRGVARRLRVCRLCHRVFVRSATLRARQEYCAACRRRSKQKRWYWSGGKEKLQQRRAEARRRQRDEATRTR